MGIGQVEVAPPEVHDHFDSNSAPSHPSTRTHKPCSPPTTRLNHHRAHGTALTLQHEAAAVLLYHAHKVVEVVVI